MDVATISGLQFKLGLLADVLQKVEERATAGQLALEMIHEIKNPLEALGHLTYLASQEADDPDKVRTYMRLAEEQMRTLDHVVGQTLGFARSSQAPKPIDLAILAEAALRIHQRIIDTRKIRLVKDLPQGLVAEVYRGEILQVISNLIVNALDALPANGAVCIRLRKRRGEIHIIVSDNGHGIPAEHRDEIFQPFFTTKADRGTGLGLALSRKIIEHHHGRICMQSSVRPGRSGTIFKICLPAKAESIC
jgi:signal transduction histidine kinase